MAKRVSVVQNGTPSEEAEQQMQENAAAKSERVTIASYAKIKKGSLPKAAFSAEDSEQIRLTALKWSQKTAEHGAAMERVRDIRKECNDAADEGREQYEQVTLELGPERLRLERKATNALEAAKVACNDLVRMILDPQGEMFPATDPREVDD
jgi:hypothetical protein